MQGWYCVESLTGQRHDRVQTERQELQPWTAVSTLLGLVSKVQQVGKLSADRLIIHYPLNADDDDLRWNSNPNRCQLAIVICKTRDKGQLEKSRISCCCRDKETADRRQKLSRRKMSSISNLKRPTAHKNTEQSKHNDAKDRKRKFSRICKRSDQPKMERLETMMQLCIWYYVESLRGQRHDRVQTESQGLQPWTAVSTLLGLVSTV